MPFEKVGFILCDPLLRSQSLTDHELSIRRRPFGTCSALPCDRYIRVRHETFDTVGEARHESCPPKLTIDINLLPRRFLRFKSREDRFVLKPAQFRFTQSSGLLRCASLEQRRWPQQTADLIGTQQANRIHGLPPRLGFESHRLMETVIALTQRSSPASLQVDLRIVGETDASYGMEESVMPLPDGIDLVDDLARH